ncbi:MAG: Hsp20/alpha crystallin family protein [Reichenbachiella sp.]
MSLIKYNPRRFASHGAINLFDELLNDKFFNSERSTEKSFVPQVDVSETDQAFELQFAVPGLSKEEISIDLKNGVLTVSGERKFEEKKEGKNFHSIETKYGSFNRSFQLPDSILEENVEAKYENGILNVVVPKDVKKTEKKSIAIK